MSFVFPNVPDISAMNGYNVKLYGLKGDGTTDDRGALNTLLNTTAPTGSTIFFPPGTYLIGSNIAVSNKQFNLIGSGTSAILKITANTQILNISSTAAAGSKWKIQNLSFLGNDTGASQAALYFSDNSGGFVIDTCTFTDFGYCGVALSETETSDVLGGLISNSVFRSNNIGVDGSVGTRAEYLKIIGCDFILNATGIILGGGNCIVDGCNVVYNTDTGIEVVTGTNNGHGIISNCNINHNTTYGLDIHNTTLGMTVADCHIYENPLRVATTTGVKFIGGDIDVTALTFDTNTDCEISHVYFPNAYANTPSVAGTYPTFFRCTGTVPSGFDNNNGAWVDYSATSTIVGWTSYTTKLIKYTVIGKTVTIAYSINGTSNATSTSFTVPFTNLIMARARGCYAVNNGTAFANGGVAFVNTNSGTVTIYTDWALAAAWTGSGTKQIVGEIEIEI